MFLLTDFNVNPMESEYNEYRLEIGSTTIPLASDGGLRLIKVFDRNKQI